jgi:ribosomal protein S18 acetylase RimI-like enzyme
MGSGKSIPAVCRATTHHVRALRSLAGNHTPSGVRFPAKLPVPLGILGRVVFLRVLTRDDWALWRDVRLAALAEAPQAFKSRIEDWEHGGEQLWRASFTSPGTHNIVAFQHDRAVGMARGIAVNTGVCELRSVWVSPDSRGRQVGDRLIEAVASWALRSGANTLRLAVIPGNESAIGLYQRHGFAFSGQLGHSLADGRREQVMVKALR